MLTPTDLALARGWPGRLRGDNVIQRAAQPLQTSGMGGGAAREHAESPSPADDPPPPDPIPEPLPPL